MLRHVTEVLGMWHAEVGPADDLRPEDVCDEVFDVVKPRRNRITCADLVVRTRCLLLDQGPEPCYILLQIHMLVATQGLNAEDLLCRTVAWVGRFLASWWM